MIQGNPRQNIVSKCCSANVAVTLDPNDPRSPTGESATMTCVRCGNASAGLRLTSVAPNIVNDVNDFLKALVGKGESIPTEQKKGFTEEVEIDLGTGKKIKITTRYDE